MVKELIEKDRARDTKEEKSEQTNAVESERNDLLLELAKLCYRYGEFSECVRYLEKARRLGVKDAVCMFGCFLDDSPEFRHAAEIHQFLEKRQRPS